MPKPLSRSHGQRGSATTRNFILITAIVIVTGLVWYTGVRIRRLNRELAASEQRAERMNDRLREYSEELESALGRARAARNRAESAEMQAAATGEELEQTRQEVEAVTAEREVARAETARTQEELEAIQRRRAAELDRMQEALNKIAPTRRTPAGMVMVLGEKHFRFAFDKADISAENREMLSRIAGILLASEGYRLFIDGHTDDIGSADYNQGLSERRANSVRDYLVAAGIPDGVIETNGFGKRQPLSRAQTKAARADNRRVEIGIVDTIVHYQGRVRN